MNRFHLVVVVERDGQEKRFVCSWSGEDLPFHRQVAVSKARTLTRPGDRQVAAFFQEQTAGGYLVPLDGAGEPVVVDPNYAPQVVGGK